ncbi:MAG: ABC transporter permease, partial [Lachnospiraceae bacterium]|nr:ABC transporter permease [Lachnospiraceae bacterium]
MLFKENVILALRSLKSNKMRAFLTMLGIIIGVSAVIAILTVGNSITKNVTSMMNGLGANDVFIAVQEKKNSTETEDEIKALKVDGLNFGKSSSSTKMQQSDYITTEMIYSMCEEFKDEIYAVNIYDQLGNADVAYEGKKAKNSVVGTSVGFYLSNSVDVVEGTMFSPSDFDEGKYTCLIPTYTAKRLFGKNYKDAIGQEITAETSYGDVLLTVIGVYKTNGRNGMMMQMGTSIHSTYVPLKTAMALDHSSGQYSFFQVSAKDGINPNSLKGKVKSFLEPYFRNNAHYTVAVVTYENILNMFYKLLGMITLAISIIAGIALLVGGIGVMNIMLVSVT